MCVAVDGLAGLAGADGTPGIEGVGGDCGVDGLFPAGGEGGGVDWASIPRKQQEQRAHRNNQPPSRPKKARCDSNNRVQGLAPDCDPANMSQPSSNLFMEGSFLHPRYNLECTFVRRCIVSAMSNSIPNQVEAGSTGSTMAGPISAANANPETADRGPAMRTNSLG